MDDLLNSTLDSTSASATTYSDYDSDVEIIGQTIPRPLDSTSEGLVKKDNDPISENKPFNNLGLLNIVFEIRLIFLNLNSNSINYLASYWNKNKNFYSCHILQKNGRIYKIGDRLIEIHHSIVQNLMQWNDSQRDNIDIDYAFGLSLLLSLVPIEDIASGKMDNNAMNFVLGMSFSSNI